ncbi:MAG: response regulator [Terriglobales bacterium]
MARRILLADDSVTAQNMGRRILTDAGYEVVTVNNGSAALKKIAENRPDIIVLDVYMPGYSGLEVCQRVKAAPETARVPVLLTVGKLEPFKPEEAKRAGADAFIVKPFEATELLTALTRLEDKIVAAPQPQKSGRFARALAAVEGSDFGDRETGWKNRLTIPDANAKSKPAEAEAPEISIPPARDLEVAEAGKPVEPATQFERPIPAGLPADITPEEIAAITAAAAAFDGQQAHPIVIPEGSASESAAAMQAASAEIAAAQAREQEAPAATLASATESETPAPAEVAAESAPAADAVSDVPAVGETAGPEEHPAATELPTPAVEIDSASQATEDAKISGIAEPSGSDAEVMAAIASLAPSNGHGGEGAPAAGAGVAGPRWIAESAAISAEESGVALEQEMEQAAAAASAEKAIRNDIAAVATIEIPAAVVEVAEPAIASSANVVDAIATESVPAPVPAIAEGVAVDASAVQGQTETAEPTGAKEESAYAAAAAAGTSADHMPALETASAANASAELASGAAASAEVAPQREAELAAAWQNWKQIRESFVSAPPAAPVQEATAAASATQEEAAASASPSTPASADEAEPETAEAEVDDGDAPEESTAIASIVDTMLAELRPKLVEEIAKKMNSEKKQKEKEKKKKK